MPCFLLRPGTKSKLCGLLVTNGDRRKGTKLSWAYRFVSGPAVFIET